MEVSINELRELVQSNPVEVCSSDEFTAAVRDIVDTAIEDYTTTTDVESIVEKMFDEQSYIEESSDLIRRVDSLLDDSNGFDFDGAAESIAQLEQTVKRQADTIVKLGAIVEKLVYKIANDHSGSTFTNLYYDAKEISGTDKDTEPVENDD